MNLLLYFVAILSLSQAAGLARLANAPPEVIGFWRLIGAALIMFCFSVIKGDLFTNFKALKSRSGLFALCSGVFFFAHLWTYKYAAQHTSIANTMILFSTNPLITALSTIFLFKEKFEKRLWLVYALGIAGVLILVSDRLEINSTNSLGDGSALISAFLFSVYIITGHQARKTLSNSSYTYFIYFIAALSFLITSFARESVLIGYSSQTWFAILALILFPTLLGHALFSYLLRFVNINLMSTGKLVEPILASLTAYFIFGETWNPNTAYSFILTGLALVVLLRPRFAQKS